MPQCIECDNFDGEDCTNPGFVAKCPEIHLECRGYVHTTKYTCLKNYDDHCKHRDISNDPFSKDWCNKKHDYCNNNKLNLRKKK